MTPTPRPHRRRAHRLLPFALGLCLAAAPVVSPVVAPAAAENWPHWRGPRFDGTSHETGLPTTWSAETLAWTLPLPGPGGSTPVVWGDRIFLTTTTEGSDDLQVLAVDRKGEVLWRHTVGQGSLEVFARFAIETTPASPSPVTDGERLYTLFGTGTLTAFDFDGKVLWQKDLAKEYGAPNTYFGLSSSPLVWNGTLIFQNLHTDRQLVLALDPKTGDELWVHDRKTDARAECLHSYASPMPFDAGDTPQVLVHGADYITGHRLSDGAEVWRHGGLNPEESYNPAFRLVASPVVAGDLVVVPSAKRGPVYALRPAGASGDVTAGGRHRAWLLDRGTPDVPSPLVHDGLLYLAGENGRLTVVDIANGETVYAERVHQSTHRGSPVLADGKLYLTATDGTVSVIRPGRTFEVLAQNTLDDRLAASPAISEGVLYLRGDKGLHAVGGAVAEPEAKGEAADPETTTETTPRR